MTDHLISDSVVTELVRLISNETGLRFDGHQLETARRGIRDALARSGEHDPQRILQQISSNSPVFDDLVSELTIGETYFFREPAQFAVIRHQLLPSISKSKGPNHQLRIWSAGCATGEEPYSIAMLLHELRMLERSHVLATDISHNALSGARAGRYRPWSLRGSDNPLLKEFLIADGDDHVVDERIRSHVVFEYLNLALDTYPSFATGTWGLDLILCRNVLIYFDRRTVAAVAKRYFDCLSPGGWLILGASDPSLSEFAPFETRMTDAGTAYRRPTQAESSSALFSIPSLEDVADATTRSTPIVAPVEVSSDPPRARSNDRDASRTTGLEGGEHHAQRPAETASDVGQARADDSSAADDVAASIREIRETANVDAAQAEQRCARAVIDYPVSVELRFLHAVLLLELERNTEAVEAARRVVFLDRELAIAHMTLGTALQRTGQISASRRAFRNAHQLCANRPADEIVRLSDGEHAGRLALSAKQHLSLLDDD